MRTLVLIVLGVFAMIVIADNMRAFAHSWYPASCCAGNDCAPLDDKRVRVTPNGFLIDEWFFIPRGAELRSMDGRYHACFPRLDNLRCFFAPPPAT